MIEIGGVSWENTNFASIDISPETAGTCSQHKVTHNSKFCYTSATTHLF
jgi:hypothetical protein